MIAPHGTRAHQAEAEELARIVAADRGLGWALLFVAAALAAAWMVTSW